MSRLPPVRSFSLIEIIVAVALFTSSIVVVLALLPALAGRGTEAADRTIAQQLPAALRLELRRLGSLGFEALAGQAPVMGMPLENGLAFVASRNGVRLHARDYLAPATGRVPEPEQYFLIECWRFPARELQFDAADSALALVVRVSWPYRQPNAPAPTPPDARHEFMFAMGLNR